MTEVSNYEKMMEKEQYRLDFIDMIYTVTHENVDELAEKLKNEIEIDPDFRFYVFFKSLINVFPVGCNANIPAIAQLISKTLKNIKNLKVGIISQFSFSTSLISVMQFHREMCVIFGYLVSNDVFSKDEVQLLTQNLIRAFLIKNPTLFNSVFLASFFVICSDYLKANFVDAYQMIKSSLITSFGYFPSPQAKSLLNEFINFSQNNQRIPYKYLQIFQEDKPELIPDDVDKEEEFFPSIFDTSHIIFCPSLIAAAAYFKANKCVKKLFDLGFNIDYPDQFGKTLPYYAGLSGNYEAIKIVGETKERIKLFISGAIRGKQNEIFKEIYSKWDNSEPLFKHGQTLLHKACSANNYKLVQDFISTIDVNIKDEADDLAQHSAARKGSIEAFLSLTKAENFDLEARNFSDMSVFELAIKNSNVSLIRALADNFKPYIDKEKVTLIIKTSQSIPQTLMKVLSGEQFTFADIIQEVNDLPSDDSYDYSYDEYNDF